MNGTDEQRAIDVCRGALDARAEKAITGIVMAGMVRKATYQLPRGFSSAQSVEFAREEATLALYRVAAQEPSSDGSPDAAHVLAARAALDNWEREAKAQG